MKSLLRFRSNCRSHCAVGTCKWVRTLTFAAFTSSFAGSCVVMALPESSLFAPKSSLLIMHDVRAISGEAGRSTVCMSNMLSLRQLSARVGARHLCRVCGTSHVFAGAVPTPWVRPRRLNWPAQLGSRPRRALWQRCNASAADAAIDAGAASQVRQHGSGGDHAAAARQGPSFQDAIAALQSYWSSKGCAVCLPHNTEVCAVTEPDVRMHMRSHYTICMHVKSGTETL